MPGSKNKQNGCRRSAMLRLNRAALLLIACYGVPMIHGCAQNEKPKVVDLASVRCPPIASRDSAALSQRPSPPPAGDMMESQARSWVDDKDSAINSMRLAGGRVIRQYDRCRDGAGS